MSSDDSTIQDERLRFWAGAFSGVAACASVFLVVLSRWFLPGPGLYGDFKAKLPGYSQLAVSPFWRVALPIAIMLSLLYANRRGVVRRRVFITTGVICLVSIVLVVFTAWASIAPLFATAPQIRAD